MSNWSLRIILILFHCLFFNVVCVWAMCSLWKDKFLSACVSSSTIVWLSMIRSGWTGPSNLREIRRVSVWVGFNFTSHFFCPVHNLLYILIWNVCSIYWVCWYNDKEDRVIRKRWLLDPISMTMSFMDIRKSIGPGIEPWGTPERIQYQLVIHYLIFGLLSKSETRKRFPRRFRFKKKDLIPDTVEGLVYITKIFLEEKKREIWVHHQRQIW